MPAQNNTGRQYDKQHGVTVAATVALVANRFIAYDGGYATSAGRAKDSQGVSESDAASGDALTVVTGYSALVEAGEAIAFGEYIKPGANGVAMVGASNENCGRALGAAAGPGQLIEAQVLQHVHAAAIV